MKNRTLVNSNKGDKHDMGQKTVKKDKGFNPVIEDTSDTEIRKGKDLGGFWKLRKGFPRRDRTMDDENLRRNTYYGLPPDFGPSYGKANCKKCSFSYVTAMSERPFCPACSNIVELEPLNDGEFYIPKETQSCSACDSVQYVPENKTKIFCTQCGNEMEKVMKNKKKIHSGKLLKDTDQTSMKPESQDEEIDLNLEEDTTSFDEEINKDEKSVPPDADPINDQMNDLNDDKTGGEQNLNAKAQDEDKDLEDDAESQDEDELDEDAESQDEDVDLNVEDDAESQDEDELEDDDTESQDEDDKLEDDDTEAQDEDELDEDAESQDEDEIDLDIEDDTESQDEDEDIDRSGIETQDEDEDLEDDAESQDENDDKLDEDAESQDEDVDLNVEDDAESQDEDELDEEEACLKSGDEEENEEDNAEADDGYSFEQEDDDGQTNYKTAGKTKTKTKALAFCLSSDILKQKDITSDRINASLFNSDTENPQWNITIDGTPVAAICLKDQDRPEELSDLFVKADYGNTICAAIEEHGVKTILDSVKARYFVNKIEENALASKMKTVASQALKKQYKNKVLAMVNDFSDAFRIAIAGFNKNFWDVKNLLKASLYTKFKDLGIKDPTPYIEASFAESGNSFFDAAINKAIEIMAKSKETKDEIRGLVEAADVAYVRSEDENEIEDAEEVSTALAKGNFPIDTGSIPKAGTLNLHLGPQKYYK